MFVNRVFISIVLNLLVFSLWSQNHKSDTVYLKSNQVLVTKDVLYFGTSDSVVVIPDSVKYVITKNTPKTTELLEGYVESILLKEPDIERIEEDFNKAANFFKKYEGKIIRDIKFVSVPIFEGNVNDTTIAPHSKIVRAVSKSHVPTNRWILKQNIRLKKNTLVVPSLVSENERLLRNLPYIEDARIYLQADDLFIDSVDVIIVTKDNYPYGIGGEYSNINRFVIEPYNRNMFGMGHALAAAFIYNNEGSPNLGYGATYKIDNISGFYTSGLLQYEHTFETKLYRLNVDKPFLTNDIQYGGGVELYQMEAIKYWFNYYSDSVVLDESPFRSNVIDVWGSRSFFLFPDDYSQIVNLSFRYKNEKYLDRPEIDIDSNYQFHDTELYLGSLRLSNLNFYKTARLFGYGVTEDIPYGRSISFTSGVERNNYYRRLYLGAKGGLHFSLKGAGYFSMRLSMGTFLYDNKTEDVKLGFIANYFSPFRNLGTWGMRHSFEPSFLSIENPRYLTYDNFGKRIRNLNQLNVFGLSNAVIRYEPFFYTPYGFLSFKLSFSVFGDVGWISSNSYLAGYKEVYAALGGGIHIKSESLTLPNLTIEAGYYPNNDENQNAFKVSFIFRDRSLGFNTRITKPSLYY